MDNNHFQSTELRMHLFLSCQCLPRSSWVLYMASQYGKFLYVYGRFFYNVGYQ